MKRDIKVNYGILSSIVSDLKQYNEAIESIDGLLININKKLENENDGKAIEALRNKYDKLKVQIDSCKEETKDLYNIFNNYINDMTDIIKPIDEQKMMRVSRNDIYFNKVSIGNACDNIGSIMSGILTSLGSAGTLLTSGTKIKNNIVKMYAISSLAKATSQSLQNDMDDINKLYNENVISYENMDDTYKSKASELYDKYSSVWEKFTTTVGGIGKASVDIVKGFFSSLVGLVKGVFDILKAAVVYIGAGFGAISEKITGDAPDCLKSCERKVKEYNKTIVEIVKDPFSLIEGLSQTLNDTYEEKGIAYMGGYVVGEVAQVLLLKKVSGVKSAKGIDGVEDAAKTVKNVDKAEDVAKGVKGVESVDVGSKILTNGEKWNKYLIEKYGAENVEWVTNTTEGRLALRERVLNNINESKIARESSAYKGVSKAERLILGTPGVVTGGDSTKLGKNIMESMGLKRSTKWTGHQAQHIIPAEMADNQIIQKIGMDLDDATNGILLRTPDVKVSAMSRHRGYHSVYNDVVRNQLNKMDINQSVEVLQKQVFDLQSDLRKLQESGLPLYPSQGETVDLWERSLSRISK